MTTGAEEEKGKDGATTNRGVKFSHLVERQESFEEETLLGVTDSKLLVGCCAILDIAETVCLRDTIFH